MKKSRFLELQKKLKTEVEDTFNQKGPAYTGESKDCLANFKKMAEKFNVSPLLVWGIYFNKHVDAINSFITNPDLSQGSEPIETRLIDIINYSYLGHAIIEEEKENSIVRDLSKEGINLATEIKVEFTP